MTFGNPFEENTEAPAPAAPAVAVASSVPTSTNAEAFTGTFKSTGGYEGEWLVIRGATAEEYERRVNEAVDKRLFDLTSRAAAEFRKSYEEHGGGAQTRQANARPAPQQRQQAAPSGHADPNAPAGSCEHGALVLNEWEWNGKQMRRYQCPTKTANRGKGGCDAKVWADKVQAPIPF